MQEIVVFWFRRDLRLHDNKGLSNALRSGFKVLPIFIFDQDILSELPVDDARVSFIHQQIQVLDKELKQNGSSLKVLFGQPKEIIEGLKQEFAVKAVYANEDYEPYARQRDTAINELVDLKLFKDQVVFAKDEVVKDDGKPYTIYTPYKRKWLHHFQAELILEEKVNTDAFIQLTSEILSLQDIGFQEVDHGFPEGDLSVWLNYGEKRNFPALQGTSLLGLHLRFGTVSVREVLRSIDIQSVFASEIIWREFFMQILYHFPQVVTQSFKSKYDNIVWRNNEHEFEQWKKGETGYPMVDAGMRELNATGHMHNRVRMVVASFLCKHLLIDWRWGEAYFAEKLLDYDLSANNGNWQWAAGCGCDAAPYFRVFNPYEQHKKFDAKSVYVKRWVPEYDSLSYVQPIVEHKFARERALKVYKEGIAPD